MVDKNSGTLLQYILLQANQLLYIHICSLVQLHCVVSSHQLRVDELSEGLIWASGEGCLEDVVFLLSTGVEVNSKGQVRGSATVRSLYFISLFVFNVTVLTHVAVLGGY